MNDRLLTGGRVELLVILIRRLIRINHLIQEISSTPSSNPHPSRVLSSQALSYGARMNGKRVVLGGLDKNVDVRTVRYTARLCDLSRLFSQFSS